MSAATVEGHKFGLPDVDRRAAASDAFTPHPNFAIGAHWRALRRIFQYALWDYRCPGIRLSHDRIFCHGVLSVTVSEKFDKSAMQK